MDLCFSLALQVPADELVPGDLVLLEEGDQAPADARILETISLASEEAILTGESVAISKVRSHLKFFLFFSNKKYTQGAV